MNFAIASSTVHVRWMIRRDMPAVELIENESFEHPWCEDDFIRCLRQRNCIGMVAERRETVCGYMIYELHKYRLHLFKLAVRGSARRSGVGSAMLNKLKTKLGYERRARIMLEVQDSAIEAQLFLRALGFKATSVLRDFYDPGDAYFFQYRLGQDCQFGSDGK